MTKFIGRRGSLGVAKEASRGTAVAPAYWIPNAKMSFFDGIESASESQGLGNIADQDSFYVTFKMAQGSVDAELYDTALGYILMGLLGAAPVTTGGSPYTHTFTLSQTNTAQTLTFYWKDPDRNYAFRLGVIDSLKITAAPKGMVEYSFTIKSRKSNDWGTLSPTFTSLGSKFLHQHVQVRLASSIGGLSGASKLNLTNFDMTINRNSMFDETMGTVEPIDILSQQLSVEGTLELKLEDETYRNLMRDNTYDAMEVKFVNGANSILQLQFPRVSFSQWTPDFTLNAISKQKINFKANYDATNGLDIISTAVLTNLKTSY
ncbi:MAG: hypothetical protein EPO02_13590 [Nitrospirae bacterium]|nr:MAG: hypothetical protein EPO02_13590 [Nitrospirota bacterium]